MSLHDIKDKTPNTQLIDRLERLLESAKSGDIRSAFYVVTYDDDCVSHGWCLDDRTAKRMMLAEMVISQSEFILNIGLSDGDSILARAIEE